LGEQKSEKHKSIKKATHPPIGRNKEKIGTEDFFTEEASNVAMLMGVPFHLKRTET